MILSKYEMVTFHAKISQTQAFTETDSNTKTNTNKIQYIFLKTPIVLKKLPSNFEISTA